MQGHRPTREEVVEYVATIVQREGPLTKERQEEVILEAFETLRKKRKQAGVEKTYH